MRNACIVCALILFAGLAPPQGPRQIVVFEARDCPACMTFRTDFIRPYWRAARHDPAFGRIPLRVVDVTDLGSAGVALGAPLKVFPTAVILERGIEIARVTGDSGRDIVPAMLDAIMKP